jgi:hypothetical protein
MDMKTLLVFTASLLLLFFCSYLLGGTEDALAVEQPTVTITVNPNGTFTPNVVNIAAGQTIQWVNLSITDSIVQIGDPAGFSTSDVCGITDNDLDHAFVGSDPNEFTGPTRKGVSGIFVLSEDEEGYLEKRVGEPCGHGEIPLTVDSWDGNTYKLCPQDGASNQMLDTTWENPDITGVILRLNWNRLQTDSDGDGVPEYDWSDLDREMNKAVENGKLFTLDVSAGKGGTPPWIFTTYTGTISGTVTPHFFKDWASEDEPPNGCGFTMTLGSPTDTAYRDLYIAMIEALADHVASDARWFQALAHVKLSGANLITSEARLPKRCYNEGEPHDNVLDSILKSNGELDDCICNSQVWAAAGYTPGGLYEYYRVVGNAIYNAFYQRKSLGFQLIQDGFPQVESATNFAGDSLLDQNGNNLLSPPGVSTDDPRGLEQTEMILRDGRYGRFTDPANARNDPYAGKLFVPQHSGLGLLPQARNLQRCSQGVEVDAQTQKARFPIPVGTQADGGPGCPNPWAVEEGTLYSQVMGFQTQNTSVITTPALLDSALWNLTINSNGVFLEIYEPIAWQIYHTLGTGASAPPLDASARYPKNLSIWTQELHERRKALVEPANPHLSDPFPVVYQHTFAKAITETESYYYINPARCSMTAEPARVGQITVSPSTGALSCNQDPAQPGCLYSPNTHYTVSPIITTTITYTDIAGLPRSVPIAIRIPMTAPVPLPVVIWSHGGAEGHINPTKSMVEWSETTAEAGYLTISIAHPTRTFTPTDTRTPLCRAIAITAPNTPTLPGGQWNLRNQATCAHFKYLNWDRPHDIRAVLDDLERRNRRGPLQGRIDLAHIAVGGHSSGSSGALTVGGALRNFTGTALDLSDPAHRPVAYLAFSPQPPGTEGFFDTGYQQPLHSWQPITRPVLFGTGDGDNTCDGLAEPGSCFGDMPYGRRIAFERVSPGGKYRIYFHDAATFHELFDLNTHNQKCDGASAQQKCDEVARTLRSVALAFLDGYLREDAFALQWLAGNDVELATDGVAEWSRK